MSNVNDLYDQHELGQPEGAEPTNVAKIVEDYLNEAEQAGFTLVAALTDHQRWNAEGEPDGRAPSMLILHKPTK